jgi:hypothetical protein
MPDSTILHAAFQNFLGGGPPKPPPHLAAARSSPLRGSAFSLLLFNNSLLLKKLLKALLNAFKGHQNFFCEKLKHLCHSRK